LTLIFAPFSVLKLTNMDDDLAAIRAKRMAELRAQQVLEINKGAMTGSGLTGAGMAGAGPDAAEAKQKQQQMEEMRHGMLVSILSPEARERRSSS
jgi:DNA-binding TFAR19-related protein (PDSD5 family)